MSDWDRNELDKLISTDPRIEWSDKFGKKKAASRPKPARPSVPSVICGACGGGPDDCECKPEAFLLEGAVEIFARVKVNLGVKRHPGGAIKIGRAWLKGRELTDEEREQLDLEKIVEAVHKTRGSR